MPRGSYYIPAGNPIRRWLLPKRAMSSEFLCSSGSAEASRQVRNQVLRYIALIELAILIVAVTFGQHFPVATVIGAGFYVAIEVIIALQSGAALATFRLMALSALGAVIAIATSGSPAVVLPLLGVLLGVGSFDIGSHWLDRCTASPLSKEKADRVRRRGRSYLMTIACAPTVAALVALATEQLSFFAAFLICFSLLQLMLTKAPVRAVRSGLSALTSWLAYDIDAAKAPGLFESQAGTALERRARLVGHAVCFALLCHLLSPHPPNELVVGIQFPFLGVFALPMAAFTVFSVAMVLPLLHESAGVRKAANATNQWPTLVSDLRKSANPLERETYFQGNLAADNSPLLIGRAVFNDHAHFLGAAGSGKTSKGLNPWIEQTVGFGDSSVIVIDLKGDTLEMLSTMSAAAEAKRRADGTVIPLKVFALGEKRHTHAFNPLSGDFWQELNLDERTDILCGAMGLLYGSDYGRGHYSAVNASVIRETFEQFPHCGSIREFAERCGYVVNAKSGDLSPEARKSATHLREQLKRLAAYEQLQPHQGSGHAADVVENAIDIADCFRRPQLLYLRLNSSISAGSAPTVARLLTYMLLAAASEVDRKCQVYLVIDEFQRMASENLDYLLQLARSMNVGLVLSNQSMADLSAVSKNLISCVETNCRYRQWFSVGCREDRDRVMAAVGETVESFTTEGSAATSNGTVESISRAERLVPRLSVNDISAASSHPDLSIVHLARDDGYAQFGGLPIVVRSSFHITKEEYERRRHMPWPEHLPGTFVPREHRKRVDDDVAPTGPTVIREVHDFGSDEKPRDINDLFEGLKPETPKKPRRRKDKK